MGIPVVVVLSATFLAMTGVVAAGLAAADERPLCWGRAATILGAEHDDILVGTRRSDVIVGTGQRVIKGRGGRDFICAHGSLIRAGRGNDAVKGPRSRIFGGRGHDTLRGVGAHAHPGPGRDQLLYLGGGILSYAEAPRPMYIDLRQGVATGFGLDVIADAEVRVVEGSAHNDVIVGNEFRQFLRGMEGDDVLHGRGNLDWLFGGPGHDLGHGGRYPDNCFDIEEQLNCAPPTSD